MVTGGKNPKGNNFFGEGSFKNPYRSFLAHANRCSNVLDGVVYDDPSEYVDAAVSAKIYLDGAGQSVKNLIPKIQNLIK